MMYLNDNYVSIGNNKVSEQIKGFNVDIIHYCSVNKEYRRYITSDRFIDYIGAKTFVVPRAIMASTSYSVVLDKFDDVVPLLDMRVELNNECSECPYTENCNGQMCFFSMI